MCIVCGPEFANAIRALSFKSRRQFLCAAAAATAGAFVAETVGPALADGSLDETLASGLAVTPITIFVAKKIVTMERDNPTATAVAVEGDRIVAAGSLDEVKAALGARPYRIDRTFADKVVLPGLIDQHLHPILGALTLAVEVIAPEDWVLPGRTYKAAMTPEDYRARLKAAVDASKDSKDWFFTWGYHGLWHGPLSRADLNTLSATRPIAVWQRSCHEFYLNDAAIAALGVTEQATRGKGEWSEQVDFANGHFWEGGLNFIIGPMMKVLATPDRLSFGLKQMVAYLHANGVTAYNEPGALYTPDMWMLYEQILGAPGTPMYATFLADGRGILDRVGLDKGLAGGRGADRGRAGGAGQEADVLPGPDQALRRRGDHLATDADEGRLSRRPQGRVDHSARRTRKADAPVLERRLPDPHPRQRRSRPRGAARHHREADGGESARRPPHGDRPFRQFDRGAGRPHRTARRDRQRQSLLPGRLRRQIRRSGPRAATRRRDGARGFRAQACHPALLSFRSPDGAGRAARAGVVRRQPRSRPRAGSQVPSSASASTTRSAR